MRKIEGLYMFVEGFKDGSSEEKPAHDNDCYERGYLAGMAQLRYHTHKMLLEIEKNET